MKNPVADPAEIDEQREQDNKMQRTILVVDDENLVRWSIRQKFLSTGYQVLEAPTATEAMALFRENLPDLVTLDIQLPDGHGLKVLMEMKSLSPSTPVIMITAHGAVEDAVKALQIGAFDYMEKPIDFGRLLHSVANALETSELRKQVETSKREQRETYSIDQIVGESNNIQEIKRLVERIAASEAQTLLIQGESGTGKDLVAKALHYHSRRSAKPFVVLNCAAVPEQLLESELFGHERGAFTDAKTLKKGLFELASGGTLFFDEISEMNIRLQSKVLRVLEDQTFRRIGGTKDIRTDARVICASNRDLEKLVAEGSFRSDLFYRLSVIPINLPPLNERLEDIPLLVEHFIRRYNQRFRKSVSGISPAAMKILLSYSWPGNIRELKNVIERALILKDEGIVDVDLLPLRLTEGSEPREDALPMTFPAEGLELQKVERELIRLALERAGGNKTRAARLLSITRDTLRYKLKKHKIHFAPRVEA